MRKISLLETVGFYLGMRNLDGAPLSVLFFLPRDRRGEPQNVIVMSPWPRL
jgi:hypothetical protein